MSELSLELQRLARDGSATMDADLIEIGRKVKAMEDALKPFSEMAGELFSDNWNASDNVFLLDRDSGGVLTAGDFFEVRKALEEQKDG